MKKNFKRIVLITIGIFIMCVALHFFLIPADLATGGVTGLAMIIQYHYPDFPISTMVLILNVFLLILGFIVIGKDFGAVTIYSSIIMSVFFRVFETFFPNPVITEDLLINLIYGIFIGGVGMAIVFFQNASTGGTDIIAKIINKYTYIDIGKALFLSDALVVILAMLTFSVEKGLYAFLGMVMNSIVIDGAIARISSKLNLMIMTNKIDDVNVFINKIIDRGTTLYLAQGGYTQEDKKVINTVCNRKQFYEIKKYVEQIDPNAFIFSTQLNDVYGNGFTFFLD